MTMRRRRIEPGAPGDYWKHDRRPVPPSRRRPAVFAWSQGLATVAVVLVLILALVGAASADARETSRFARPPTPPVPAQPAPRCFARDRLVANLAATYSEHLAGGGLQSATGLIEVWTTATGSTWTILMTRPDGISCVMATGTDWATHKPAAAPAGEMN